MSRKLNIYVSHSSKMDYQLELYKPLLESKIGLNNNLILPHSEQYVELDTKQIIINADLLIAEVSTPGTGIGLELGRAECNNVQIVCVIKKGVQCNSSVKRNFMVIEYNDTIDMIEKLEEFISKNVNI